MTLKKKLQTKVRKQTKTQPKNKFAISDASETDTDTDNDGYTNGRNSAYADAWEQDEDSDEEDKANWAAAQEPSPLKRKRRSSNHFENHNESDSALTPASLNELDLADLDDSEDDLDIERFEGDALIQEEEDRRVLESKFHVVDDSQPFAYAMDEESDHTSNTEEFWIEDFDALVGGGTVFENTALPKFTLAHEESQDTQLEEEFFLGYISSDSGEDDEGEDDADAELPFGMEDDDDRVGWECFFSDGSSQSEDEDEDDSSGGTTDDEAPEVTIARHKAAKAAPVTPAKTPAKTKLTSCLKQTRIFNDETPSKTVSSTPIKLNTSHQPPVLGTWTRDARRQTGIIDGMTTHSPAGAIKSNKTPKKALESYKRSEAMTEAMTSLDDIMYTNDFLVPQPKTAPSKFDKPIQVGAFRKGQQRSAIIREGSLRDEWYNMTSRNKEKTSRTKATPVLGVASESLSRKEKRRRKKMRAAAGMSIGGSTFGGSIDEQSDNEYNDGVERTGLGLGVPVESLFLFHDY